MKIAIIGASGFLGLRLLERLHLGGLAHVVPLVHTPRSLAVIARFDLPWKVTNPSDPVALGDALKGCDGVIHAALGDARQIVAMARALYPAAERAGVKRIVAMSSAAVHSLTPAQGTDESSPILTNQKSEYNSAKAQAERTLDRMRRKGNVELVQIRPAIIHGPRSRLVTNIAGQLIAGSAYLVDGGRGICNAIAVDNLIDAIWLALTTPSADGETFLVNDAETVTWREFYAAIASGIGLDLDGVHSIVPPEFQSSASEKLARLAARDSVMAALPLVPARVKRLAKAAAAAWPATVLPNAWRLPATALPQPTEEMCLLQSCRWRYPTAKAERVLGFAPVLSFHDGMRRTASWMEFAGLAQLGSKPSPSAAGLGGIPAKPPV